MKQIERDTNRSTPPIDWDYNFAAHDWDHGGSMNPASLERSVKLLHELDEALARGEQYSATTDGGSPRVGWGMVLEVGMRTGWPYHRPMPSVLITNWHSGASWAAVTMLKSIREGETDHRTSHGF